MIETIGFDADDTLWHNETLYSSAQERFKELLAPYYSPDQSLQELYRTECKTSRGTAMVSRALLCR